MKISPSYLNSRIALPPRGALLIAIVIGSATSGCLALPIVGSPSSAKQTSEVQPHAAAETASPAQGSAKQATESESAPSTNTGLTTQTTAAQIDAALAESTDLGPPAGMPDLLGLLGGVHEGWTPPALRGILTGMGPQEVGAKIPGAERVDKFGFSKVAIKGVKGVESYKFYFNKKGIYSVQINFSRSLTTPAFYDYFVRVLSRKYGTPKPEDVSKQLITWVASDFRMVQAMKFVDHYQMELSVWK